MCFSVAPLFATFPGQNGFVELAQRLVAGAALSNAFRIAAILRLQLEVTLESGGIEIALLYRCQHCTTRLIRMRSITEAAILGKSDDITEYLVDGISDINEL